MRAFLLCSAIAGLAIAHGSHSQKPIVDANANWMTKHMAEEHHVDGWDAASFFTLHDYDSDGYWKGEELLRTYGLMDDSNRKVSWERRDDILRQLLDLMDQNRDGVVSRDEWLDYIAQGKTLPDMGTGPGHHGDDEYEYEIHHWEKYHDENSKLEDLNHPEDIEHFRKHEQMEEEEEKLEKMDQMAIIEENIPKKFLRVN
ncbi:hypothetical protein GGI43DRAFT_413820 [Trichoderma evansii]